MSTERPLNLTWGWNERDGKRPAFGMGYYTRANAEPCLLGVKGKMPPRDRGVPQVVLSPRREHSRKPEAVHDAIARLYPDARKLGKELGMATDPQRGRAGFAERRSVGQLYSRAKSSGHRTWRKI